LKSFPRGTGPDTETKGRPDKLKREAGPCNRIFYWLGGKELEVNGKRPRKSAIRASHKKVLLFVESLAFGREGVSLEEMHPERKNVSEGYGEGRPRLRKNTAPSTKRRL